MKRYEAYKDSGVEWIGDIPVNWTSSSLKWYSKIYSGGTPSKSVDEYWIDGAIPWLNSGSVNQGDIREVSAFITDEAFNNSSAKWIPNRALIIALAGQGKTKGMVAQVMFDTTCNQSLGVIVPEKKIFNRYLLYWLRRNYFNIRNLGGGDKRDGLNLEMIGSIPIPIPFLSEQTQIAHYLDYKTAQIDALIEKKERLIALLEEERTALINEVVTGKKIWNGTEWTKPSETKDSGIEWLGEIPNDWTTKRIGSISDCITGFAFKSEFFSFDSGIKLVRGDNVTEGHLRWGQKTRMWQKMSSDLEKFYLNENDIVIGMDGSKVGKNYARISKSELPLLLVQRVARIRADNQLTSRFVEYSIGSYNFKYYINFSKTDPAIPHITLKNIRDFKIVIPEQEELKKLLEVLDNETKKINTLLTKVLEEISLLKEYKTALISEVVTGKIDVRDEVIPSNKVLESVN